MNTLKSSSAIARHCTFQSGLLRGKQQQLFNSHDMIQYMTPETTQYNYTVVTGSFIYVAIGFQQLVCVVFKRSPDDTDPEAIINVFVAPDVDFPSIMKLALVGRVEEGLRDVIRHICIVFNASNSFSQTALNDKARQVVSFLNCHQCKHE